MVGNLSADGAAAWALPTDEAVRSSIIRRHVQVAIGAAAPDDGTLMDSWVLASETSFAAPTHIRAEQPTTVLQAMSAHLDSVLAVRCLLNFPSSVLPVIRSLAQW